MLTVVSRVDAAPIGLVRVDEGTDERRRFASMILPAWCRKSAKVTEVLPLLYLHGLSSKDFGPALENFLGTDAGLSAASVTRLTVQWQDEARAFNARDLSKVDCVYLWADGIHVNVRLDEEKLCLLVLIGVRVDGTKELVALTDGYRESTGSWADLLRDCKRRGMRASAPAIGDEAFGFWGALREVFPETREQRCHRTKITKGPGSKAAGIAMAFKLIEAAQARWRAVNGAHLVAPVRAGATFTCGKLVERGQRAAKAGTVAA